MAWGGNRPDVTCFPPSSRSGRFVQYGVCEESYRHAREAGVACQAMFLRSRTSPLILMREAGRLQKELAQFGPDLIHAHYGTMTAAVGALVSRVPLVITFRGSDLNPCDSVSPLRSAGGKFLSQLAALRARRIICVSEQLKGTFVVEQARLRRRSGRGM
ncbi:MAG: glycosyltransferase [Nitrospira sp.]